MIYIKRQKIILAFMVILKIFKKHAKSLKTIIVILTPLCFFYYLYYKNPTYPKKSFIKTTLLIKNHQYHYNPYKKSSSPPINPP